MTELQRRARDRQFCPDCGVTEDLHDTPRNQRDEFDCENAESQAQRLEAMDRMFASIAFR